MDFSYLVRLGLRSATDPRILETIKVVDQVLLVYERGHLLLQAGGEPTPYLNTMHNCASAGGLLPEQVWVQKRFERKVYSPGVRPEARCLSSGRMQNF
jgi:glucoamylase